jgi:hypothetical protein
MRAGVLIVIKDARERQQDVMKSVRLCGTRVYDTHGFLWILSMRRGNRHGNRNNRHRAQSYVHMKPRLKFVAGHLLNPFSGLKYIAINYDFGCLVAISREQGTAE